MAAWTMAARGRREAVGVRRVLRSEAEARRWYRSGEYAVAAGQGGASVATVAGAHVLAQPIAVAGPDWSLLWDRAPQLKRRVGMSDFVWRDVKVPARALAGETLFAAVDGFSYYHWVTGTLPKLLAAGDLGRFAHFVVNPRQKGRDSFQRETLELLGVPLEKVVWIDRGLHLACERLVAPAEPCGREQTELEAWARQLLRWQFLQKPSQDSRARDPASPTRIFVRRSQARRRRLVNEDEVVETLSRFGFVSVILESLSFLDQVRLFAGADTVVGLHGAGLTNILFSAPGAKLVEILPDSWPHPCFERLARGGGMNYRAVRAKGGLGERSGFAADARVDVEVLLAALGNLCRAPA